MVNIIDPVEEDKECLHTVATVKVISELSVQKKGLHKCQAPLEIEGILST